MRATARTVDYCDREARHLHARALGGDTSATPEAVTSFRVAEAQARERLAQLEDAACGRTAWRTATEPQRRAATMASVELARRIDVIVENAGPERETLFQAADAVMTRSQRLEREAVERDGYHAVRLEQPDPGIEI
jgi:hypothetical protein